MSYRDEPPPIFEGDDFPYWKIRMEAYLKPRDATNLQGNEVNYEKWNAKAQNTIFRGLL